MEQLKLFCKQIAFICRVRYEMCVSDCTNKEDIYEILDNEVYNIFSKMQKYFNLNNENTMLFLIFFWDYLKSTEEWKNAIAKFGKDFLYTEDFLVECFEKL